MLSVGSKILVVTISVLLLVSFGASPTQVVPLEQVSGTPELSKRQVSKYPLPSVGDKKQFGVYIYNGQMAPDVNAKLGANNLKIFGLFEHWSPEGISNENKLTSICSEGYTPLISWESWQGKNSQKVYELKDIAAGKYDEMIVAFLDDLKTICEDVNVIVRFDHEMEMRPSYGYPWTPWQGKSMEYVAAWKHVTTLAKDRQFLNVKWLWSPNRADQYIYDYYPGDDYVDYVGMTLNHPTITGTVYGSFGQFYTPNKRYLDAFNKPIIIGEAAYYSASEENIAKWIDGTFEYVRQDDRIVALVWFNQNLTHLNYGLEATTLGKEAFIRNMRSE